MRDLLVEVKQHYLETCFVKNINTTYIYRHIAVLYFKTTLVEYKVSPTQESDVGRYPLNQI